MYIKKERLLFLIILFLIPIKLSALENKILMKINNEIITSVDVMNEVKYLTATNKNLQNIDSDEIIKISLNSLTREKIKKIELTNHFEKIEIDENNLNIIIESVYKKLGFNKLNEFKIFLENSKISYELIKEKIVIESLWNELIYSKFFDKVYIDKKKLEKQIISNNKKQIKSFYLLEILFTTPDDLRIEDKYETIKTDIMNKGFRNAALIHSISETSNNGGELGWINEDAINKKLKDNISNLEVGNYTDPIIVPGGALILKIEDIKILKNEINLKEKLNELIRISTNQQLNQFSNIYFNKVQKNVTIKKL